jgi:DNA methylase
MVFTDPPYNVEIAGNVSGLGRVKHREFAMASGEMNTQEFTKFLEAAFVCLADFSTNGSIHFICMDWRHIRELLDATEDPYSELKNLCFWAKTNAGMGSLYRSQHELIFVFKKGTAPHINNVELGRFGRSLRPTLKIARRAIGRRGLARSRSQITGFLREAKGGGVYFIVIRSG